MIKTSEKGLIWQINEAKAKIIAEGFEVVKIELTLEGHEQLKDELHITADYPVGAVASFLGVPVYVRKELPDNCVFIVRKKDIEEILRNKNRSGKT